LLNNLRETNFFATEVNIVNYSWNAQLSALESIKIRYKMK